MAFEAEVFQNDTTVIDLQFLKEDGVTPEPIALVDVEFKVKRDPGDDDDAPESHVFLSSAGEVVKTDAPNGKATVEVSPDDVTAVARTYYAWAALIDDAGDRHTYEPGFVKVLET